MIPRFKERRPISRRIRIEGILETRSPCHLGGSLPHATSEQPLVRDAKGRPYLPGTTLAGLLRTAASRLGSDTDVDRLFGARWGNEDDEKGERQALLVIDDAPVIEAGEVVTELRDGVKICEKRGIAADQTKYDVELLPVGTRFALKLEVSMPTASRGGDAASQSEATRLLVLMAGLLHALERGEIALGARSRRGFGETRVIPGDAGGCWSVTEYDLTHRDGMLAWLARAWPAPDREAALGPEWPAATMERSPTSASALAGAWGGALPVAEPVEPSFRVRLRLDVDGSLLVRSGGHGVNEPDAVHLARLEQGPPHSEKPRPQPTLRPVLPGTSLAGVLRHRCLRIANVLCGEARERQALVADLVEGMFGTPGRASRLRVPEAVITGWQTLRHTRVRIDPWTGGALEGYLFTEDPIYGGSIDIELTLDAPSVKDAKQGRRGAERFLLLLALRDLATGDLQVGGESGAGRGRFRPPGDGVFARIPALESELRLGERGAAVVTPAGAFDSDMRELQQFLGGA